MRLGKEFGQLSSQARHFFFKGFTVIFLFLNAHIAPRREDIILFCYISRCCNSAKAFHLFKGAFGKGDIGFRQLRYVLSRQLS